MRLRKSLERQCPERRRRIKSVISWTRTRRSPWMASLLTHLPIRVLRCRLLRKLVEIHLLRRLRSPPAHLLSQTRGEPAASSTDPAPSRSAKPTKRERKNKRMGRTHDKYRKWVENKDEVASVPCNVHHSWKCSSFIFLGMESETHR